MAPSEPLWATSVFTVRKVAPAYMGPLRLTIITKMGEMLFGQDPNCDEEKIVMNTTVQLTTTSDYYHKDGEMLLIMLAAGKMMAIQEFFTVKTVPNN